MTKINITQAIEFAQNNLDKSIETLFGLLRIKSISSESQYRPDCIAAGQYLVDELNKIGFTASLRDGLGLPLVYATFGEGERHILFYGHYDVQPVDPINLWRRDPFEPVIEEIEGQKIIFGRGSSDDKGQVMTFVEACRAIIQTNGKLPCRVTILLEGEEESDSISLLPFMRENADILKADAAFICDTERWNETTPAITIGLRGNITGEVKIIAANRDLHSGLYGGPAANPIMVLANALAKMRDENSKITLEGFYDGVPILSNKIKENWQSLGFDEAKFLGDIGLSEPFGEKGLSALEQLWARPTAEICGINGGYTGDGFKTVIASEAFAKVSFRLVGNQDPDKIWQSFEKHILANLPKDCQAIFKKNIGGKGIALNPENDIIANTAKALEEEWNVPAALIGCGASIPVAKEIPEILGMDAILVGFAMPDDNIHSPNEKYDLKSFQKGINSWIRIIGSI
jgi:acetylornithine deacetylase/succinyl-diaminopimelate desuccinylase-like protein